MVLTGQDTLDCQTHRQDGHQRLVSHGIDDRSDYGLQVPFSRDPAIDEVSDAGIDEEGERGGVVVVKDEVANDGGGDEAGSC